MPFIVGCGQSSIALPTKSQLSEFSRNAHITLPDSAEPVAFYEESGGMDGAMWLQIKMPASDLQLFLDNSPFKGASLISDQHVFIAFDYFWQKRPMKYRSGALELPNAEALCMVIDEADPEEVMIYLRWNER